MFNPDFADSTVKHYEPCNVYGGIIGAGTTIAAFVEITPHVVIGNNCKISSHTYIPWNVTIGDGVFVGHHVSFCNDLFPRAVDENGDLVVRMPEELLSVTVEDRAIIGSGSVILPDVCIGEGAIIGAGSVVTCNVSPYTLVYGNPAKFRRNLDRPEGKNE